MCLMDELVLICGWILKVMNATNYSHYCLFFYVSVARTYVFSFQGDDCLICRGSRSILLLAAEAENGAGLFLST